jgi:tetratricopeptide (TPR) repeat protein
MIGNLVEAEQIFREVMVLGRETLPPNHDINIVAMSLRAEILVELREYFEAEKILLVLYETDVLSGKLANQLQNRSTMGDLWLRKGEARKGAETLREVLAAQKQHFGPEHRITLLTQQRFAVALLQIGSFVESEELFRDTVNKFAKTLGRNHRMTLCAEISLADFFSNRQRFGEAEELQMQVFRVSEEVYGWAASLTCSSAFALSYSYHCRGRLEEAHLMGEKAFRGWLQLLGPDHLITRDCEQKLILLSQEREQLQRSQDGGPMSMNPQHGIVVEDVGLATFGISGSGLGGIFQPREDDVGLQH